MDALPGQPGRKSTENASLSLAGEDKQIKRYRLAMKGCIGIKHTARDSSLIIWRTRRTIFPTASSACASCYYRHMMPTLKSTDQGKEIACASNQEAHGVVPTDRGDHQVAWLPAAVCPSF